MRFSVLISVYNNEKPIYLNQALDSIWDNQTLRPSEIVIVKDGYLNADLEYIVQKWKSRLDEQLVIIQLDKQGGLGKALKVGLSACNHEIVARMDSDDIAVPDRFKLQYDFLAKYPNVAVLGGILEEFEKNPGDLKFKRVVPFNQDRIFKFSKYRCPMNHMTVMFRKEAIIKVGSYEHLPYFEDYYLWTKLLRNKYEFANLNKVLVYMRVGNNMIGRRHGFTYLKSEWFFLLKLYKENYLTFKEFLANLIFRSPLRLLPRKMLKIIYQNKLRYKQEYPI